jgi:hypothetical protein
MFNWSWFSARIAATASPNISNSSASLVNESGFIFVFLSFRVRLIPPLLFKSPQKGKALKEIFELDGENRRHFKKANELVRKKYFLGTGGTRHNCGGFGNIRELAGHNRELSLHDYGAHVHNYGELATIMDGKIIIVNFPSTIVERASTTMASSPQSLAERS